MPNATLTPEVTDILNRSVIEGNILKLPPVQLARPLYDAVNRVLTNAGGKWNRSKGGHVFASDPREKIFGAVESGKSIDEKQKFQAFFTPADLADEIAIMAQVEGRLVLEPSAGHGALADACMKFGASGVVCCELQPESVVKLKAKGYQVTEGDFLALAPLRTGLYDRAVMNPPFTKGQDLKHIAHALKWINSGGILVSVLCGGKDEEKISKAVNGNKWQIRNLERGAFKESGTNVATSILTVWKTN